MLLVYEFRNVRNYDMEIALRHAWFLHVLMLQRQMPEGPSQIIGRHGLHLEIADEKCVSGV
jgi:hypothetical protein